MNEDTKKAAIQDWRDYCRLQYERIAQHENQRLTFTNVVLVVSSALLLFGARLPDPSALNITLLSLLIIAINYAAMKFIDESRHWVKYHQDHARYARRKFAPDLPGVQLPPADAPPELTPSPQEKKDSDRNPFRRAELQKLLHGALIVLAVFNGLLAWVPTA